MGTILGAIVWGAVYWHGFLLSVGLSYVVYRFCCWMLTPLNALPGPNLNFFSGMFFTLWEHFMVPEKRWFRDVAKKVGHEVDNIHTTQILGISSVVTRDKELVREILTAPPGKDGGRFMKNIPAFASMFGNGLVTNDGEMWRRHRRIMEPSFNNRFMEKQLMIMIPDMCKRFIAVWRKAAQQKREIGAGTQLSALTLDVIGMMGFNYDFNGVKNVEEWGDSYAPNCESFLTLSDPLIHAIEKVIVVDFLQRLGYALAFPTAGCNFFVAVSPKYRLPKRFLDQRVKDIVAKAKETGSAGHENCCLHLMLKAHDPESKSKAPGLNDDELYTEMKHFLMAGHETTATWMTWSMYVFCKYPDIQEKVYQDVVKNLPNDPDYEITLKDVEKMEYFKAFLQEVLRFHPPVGQIFRRTTKPEVVEGVKIPVGVRMRILIHMLHRNPKYWDEPDTFKPERWMNVSEEETERRRFAFIAFSGGYRNCIGQRLAHMKVYLILSRLIREFHVQAAPSQRDTKFHFESIIVLRTQPEFRIVVKDRRGIAASSKQ